MSYFVCYHLYMETTLFEDEIYAFSFIDYLLILVWRPVSLAALNKLHNLIVALPGPSI